jgi:ATPase subunit of ABC transporter with duplicated ATPase domains
LLTLTLLVERTEEKTLILIDEPESHLHPPLLSAMTRALSELLVQTNGVAIIATHSPVILQEVPKDCVWIMNRYGTASTANRPSIETFAENVGVLTREVFQLELTKSGYHRLLNEIRNKHNSYDEALQGLGNVLGFEGRAVLRAMYLDEQNPTSEEEPT